MKWLKPTLLFVVVFAFPQAVFAKYSGGDGTPSSPYRINSPADLIAMAGDTEDYNKHFLQTSNINLLGTTRTTALIAPDTDNITAGFQGEKFLGTYDGDGYEIRNFEIDTQGGGEDFLGLFGFIGNNGVVKNVNLVDCHIQGDGASDNCGGLCGQNGDSVMDCQVTGTVSGHNNVGGLCGYNTGAISGGYSTANADGYDYVGSLCGYNTGTITQGSAIGSASGRDRIGGLCGYNEYGTIMYSHASGQSSGNNYIGGLAGYVQGGTIKESYATGFTSGVSYVGGFVGRAGSPSISESYSLGNVEASGAYAGGFVGGTNSGTITRSYARGEVSGNNDVGGFVGYAAYGTISNSYSTGAGTGTSNVGGFCGNKNQYVNISNCFWDMDTSLLTTSAGGTGKTTPEMQDIQTYLDANWRISADVLWYYWYQPVDDYPKISWEPAVKVPDLAGFDHAEADAVISQMGLTTGQVIFQFNEELDPEIVVGQYPAAGLNRKPGTLVHLVVTANTPRHYSGGTGTVSTPYLIGGINDLLTLANNTSDYHKAFNLITDIDMADWCLITAVIAPDTSTAGGYQGQVFTGKFNGDDHRILNLEFYPNISGREYTGLFGNVGALSEISNLIIENGYTDNRWDTNYHSLLCAANYGLITECTVSGLIKGGSYVGGVSGLNKGTISQCYSTVDIQGRDRIGGLCGYNEYGTIMYSHVSGQIGGNNYIGSFAGYVQGGTVTESYATGFTSGVSNVGGFVGRAESQSINDSYALGDVEASGAYAGGFVGSTNYGTIARSYARGEVSGNNDVGGFVGYGYRDTISNSYSTGAATGTSNVGGFCGNRYSSSIISNCFWDMDTSLLTTSAGGTGKTTPEMQDIQTYLDADWRISADVLWYYWYQTVNDYPKLSWEIIAEKVPDVIDMMHPAAMTAITDARFRVGRILYQYNDQLPIGTVVNQYPKAGLNRAIYEPVDIVVTLLEDPNYSGGSGTPEEPYAIADVNDLLTAANNPTHWDRNFILTSDIDVGAWAFTTALISPDTSTANGYQGTAFEGSFNGNQHVIRNLILYPEVSGRGYLGLFGNIAAEGEVVDLGIESFKLDNRWSADNNSGLCGANSGTISRCYTIGNMKCYSYSGGLCGWNNGTIDDSYSTITIRGSQFVGGICGRSESPGVITNCHAVSDINGSGYVGGLFGYLNSSSVSNSFATGYVAGSNSVGGLAGGSRWSSLSQCFAYVDVTASGSNAGGFVGYADYSTISECCAYGDIEGVNYAGGFAGNINYGQISDSYATGWILGNDHVGGFIGRNTNGTIDRCYSIGSVVGGATAVNVGGFSGSGSCNNSFWDTDTSFMATSTSGTGLPTAQMVGMATYSGSGWSISLDGAGTTWEIAPDSYPWLSWETDVYLIPGLIGKTQADAEFEILDLGYSVGTVNQLYSDTIPVGQVISQYPPAGAITVPGASIDLVVSSGLADVAVPYVVGMQLSQAEAMIIYAKLLVGVVAYEPSPTIPAGSVISQSPSAGAQVPQQSSVDLVVSGGSGGSVIPNLVALTQAEAEDVITAEGFVLGDVILQYSDVVSKGYVIGHNPPAGTAAMPEDVIDLVISDGPMPIVVPDMRGMDEFTAIVEVFTQGLTVGIITDQYDNSVAAGLVISHTPAAGETVEAGSEVDMVISLGSTPVSVPTVIGMTQSEAVDTLIAAGLFIDEITHEYNDVVDEGLVYSQSPLQGSAVPAGTPVALWISRGPHRISVPPVVGLALETAVTAIENAELVAGSLIEQYSDDVAAGSVISQNPDADTVVDSGSAVDLVISKGPAPCSKPDWSAPFGSNVMIIYAKAEVNGTEITTPESMLGAFMEGVSAGFAEVEDKPTGTVYQLVVTSDDAAGQISFRIFNALDCTVYAIADTMEFIPGAVVGSLIEPVSLEAFTAQLRADINHDGTVDIGDFAIMAAEWLMSTN